MNVTIRNGQRLARIKSRLLAQIAARLTTKPLSIALVSDRTMARLNMQFHHVAGPTDILTFDYGDTGELVISVDHVMAQARRYRTTPARELVLYIVHGILHLQGYDDRTPAKRNSMRRAERRHLGILAGEFNLAEVLKLPKPPM